MCMEDVRINRRTKVIQTVIVVPNGSWEQIVQYNIKRTALRIANSTTQGCKVSMNTNIATSLGLPLPQNNTISFDLIEDGAMVFGPFFGAGSGGAGTITILETLLEDE